MLKLLPVSTALLLFACSPSHQGQNAFVYDEGAVIRTDTTRKEIHLIFSGDEFADGGQVIRNTLKEHHAKAAFFFTGNFYRNPAFHDLIAGLKADGHYLGGHSNSHLLYASWEKRDSLLVDHDLFTSDLDSNYVEMAKFGITKEDARFLLPPYEWHNQQIADWCKEYGLVLINYSPGTSSNADWSYPGPGIHYVTSDTIFSRILRYEKQHTLNGFILLTHIGQDPARPDPFYNNLDNLMSVLEKRNYSFTPLSSSIPTQEPEGR